MRLTVDIDRVEADEIWAFCYAKQKNVPEDFQGTEDCFTLLVDLRSRMLPGQRIQLTTDGFGSYQPVVEARRYSPAA